MKVDELLKVLENVKIDERHEIAEYIAQILSGNSPDAHYYIITKDKKIYDIKSYRKLLKSGGISPNDAYVYVFARDIYHLANYYFPFLADVYLLSYAYLSKLGLESDAYYVVPATGLKYVSIYVYFPRYLDIDYVVVEVADINTAATNMNLPKLIRGILDTKYIDGHKVKDIASELKSRILFAGYNSYEAWDTFYRYYEGHDTSLATDVEAIKDAYNHIFKPYRVVYDLKTNQFIV